MTSDASAASRRKLLFPNVTMLDLSDNSLTCVPPELSELNQLVELKLDNNIRLKEVLVHTDTRTHNTHALGDTDTHAPTLSAQHTTQHTRAHIQVTSMRDFFVTETTTANGPVSQTLQCFKTNGNNT